MDLALFDFDGTITFDETFPGFVRATVDRRTLVLGQVLLAPYVVGYKLGIVSGLTVRKRIVAFGYRGRPEHEVRAAGARHAREVVARQIRPEALERIQWHRQRGDRVVVVTASLDLFVAAWCEDQGLEFICSYLESRDGVLTGRYRDRDCCGPEKPRRVRERIDLDDYATVYAYGDTVEDLDLLDLAHRKYYRWQEVA
ncbi:HAD-superhydrolase, subIB family protein [Lysobacter antibioticus]|uniref:HAD family hydrolase n=1 Tax=Lysobacter antibioticus TaxID=84531 RepID=UPI00071706C5|nr:HAD family hydrolase [Lysobacter antibioticus]ALN60988.1 HAD-superhydrolase, subIB family protein [Lysobacter antibioticus]